MKRHFLAWPSRPTETATWPSVPVAAQFELSAAVPRTMRWRLAPFADVVTLTVGLTESLQPDPGWPNGAGGAGGAGTSSVASAVPAVRATAQSEMARQMRGGRLSIEPPGFLDWTWSSEGTVQAHLS